MLGTEPRGHQRCRFRMQMASILAFYCSLQSINTLILFFIYKAKNGHRRDDPALQKLQIRYFSQTIKISLSDSHTMMDPWAQQSIRAGHSLGSMYYWPDKTKGNFFEIKNNIQSKIRRRRSLKIHSSSRRENIWIRITVGLRGPSWMWLFIWRGIDVSALHR